MASDDRLGQLAIRAGLVTAEQLNACLEQMQKLRSSGVRISIGKVLVDSQHATPSQVRTLLRQQNKDVLTCPFCNLRYSITQYDASKPYYCRVCSGRLAYTSASSDPAFDRTVGVSASELPTMNEDRLLGRQNRTFGEIVVGKGYLSRSELDNALQECGRRHMRIGEYLVKEGLLYPAQVTEILEEQNKRILCCSQCGSRFNVRNFDFRKNYTCTVCSGDLGDPGVQSKVDVKTEIDLRTDTRRRRATTTDPRIRRSEVSPELPGTRLNIQPTMLNATTPPSDRKAREHFYSGVEMNLDGDTIGAVEQFSHCIAIEPDFSGSWFNRGVVRLNRDELASAMEDFNKTIQLNPDFAQAHLARGVIQFRLDRPLLAATDFSDYLRLEESPPEQEELERFIRLVLAVRRELEASD